MFEDEAAPLIKPMVKGEPILLSPRQQVFLGGWITKTALIINLSDTPTHDPTRDETRQYLNETMETGLPPVQTSVRIMRVQEGPDLGGSSSVSHLLPEPLPAGDSLALLNFGYVAFELILGSRDEVLPFVARTQDNDWFVRVWPPDIPQHRKVWPPSKSLSRGEYRRVKQAWVQAQRGGRVVGFSHQVSNIPE